MKSTVIIDDSISVTIPEKYGVVYTPSALADFVSHLLVRCSKLCHVKLSKILDPACGEGALLSAVHARVSEVRLMGIDIDKAIKKSLPCFVDSEIEDFIIPRSSYSSTSSCYWKKKCSGIDAIIANPPWSSDRVYSKALLHKKGFTLALGQYDSYELFIELGVSVLREGGIFAFIIPDSLFAPEKMCLRKWLLENTELKIVARLGEKIFPEVFRATTVIVGRKVVPKTTNKTVCYRLDTTSRNAFLMNKLDLYTHFLRSKHAVPQNRFLNNPLCNIDVDTTMADMAITQKMSIGNPKIGDFFVFGRGVEISKNGIVVTCQKCGVTQGIRRRVQDGGYFECKSCHEKQPLGQGVVTQIVKRHPRNGLVMMWVGESVGRYRLSNPRFVMLGIDGIDYKTNTLFVGPKLLVRKTGLGIYAAVDTTGTLTNQTVYILKLKGEDSSEGLYYYLAFLNSRVMYYFYQKMFGAAEWKSHPYLTKQVLFSLPVPKYNKKSSLDCSIVAISKKLSLSYQRDEDLELESLIAKKYGINRRQMETIKDLMSSLPELSSINDMRF